MNDLNTFLGIMTGIIAAFGYVAYRMYVKPYPAEEDPLEAPISPVDPETITSTTLPPNPSETPVSAKIRLYNLAYENIGRHLTLDTTVPVSLGCAQAVSAIFDQMGYPLPTKGISTVAKLTKWMLANGFVEEKKYGVGYVITGRNSTTAHIGICGKDWIISNTSFTDKSKGLIAGLLQANYKRENWGKTYAQVRFFRPV